MTLLNAGLQLIAWLVLLLSGQPRVEPPVDRWSISRSFDLLPTLHCTFVVGRDGELAARCGEPPAAAGVAPAAAPPVARY